MTIAEIYPVDYGRLLVLAPDTGLAIGLVTVLGTGWGVIRTVLTIRAVGSLPAVVQAPARLPIPRR